MDDSELEAMTKLFALEELSVGAWPREMCVYVVDVVGNAPRIVPPRAVKGLFEILRVKMRAIAPAAEKALENHYRTPRLEMKIKELEARVKQLEGNSKDQVRCKRRTHAMLVLARKRLRRSLMFIRHCEKTLHRGGDEANICRVLRNRFDYFLKKMGKV